MEVLQEHDAWIKFKTAKGTAAGTMSGHLWSRYGIKANERLVREAVGQMQQLGIRVMTNEKGCALPGDDSEWSCWLRDEGRKQMKHAVCILRFWRYVAPDVWQETLGQETLFKELKREVES
jgi:hypothetical protein